MFCWLLHNVTRQLLITCLYKVNMFAGYYSVMICMLYPSPILVMIMFGFLPENCEEVWEENSSNVEFEDVHEESNAPPTLPHFEKYMY